MKPVDILAQLRPAANRQFGNDRRWAEACNLPPETLSRLRKRESCDLRTLAALASAVGYTLAIAPKANGPEAAYGRAREEELLDLCASAIKTPRPGVSMAKDSSWAGSRRC